MSAQLDYAPAAPLLRRKRARRIILLVVLLLAAYPAYRYGPPVYHQSRLLYLQHRCLTYSPPADQVVYDEDSPTTAAHLADPAYLAVPLNPAWMRQRPSTSTKAIAVRPAPQLQDLLPHVPTVANLTAFGSPASLTNSATLFMHELKTPKGLRRLAIVVRSPAGYGPYNYPFDFFPVLFEPASLTGSLRPVAVQQLRIIDWLGPAGPPPSHNLRFYAGQLDPADPAHFTIAYDLEDGHGIVDGRLNDAGDDLRITIRSGPAIIPSYWSTQVLPK
jgi:hypothetical protein